MLGRTAGGLFWMFRYLERSENTARLLEAGLRIALTRSADASEEWASVLTTASARESYQEVHDTFEGPTAVDFLLRDERNPSSVLSVIGAARQNARSVRTALTRGYAGQQLDPLINCFDRVDFEFSVGGSGDDILS